MRWPDYHCLDAGIEQAHIGYDDEGMLCQLVTVTMTDDTMRLDPAVCALTSDLDQWIRPGLDPDRRFDFRDRARDWVRVV